MVVVTGRRASANVPDPKSLADPLVATAARPETWVDAEMVLAVVRTPLVVVTTTSPLVEPMAPALVILPWACDEAAAPMSLADKASDPPVAWLAL